jgi:YfiH family protein
LDVLVWPAFGGLAVDTLITTRHGGISQGTYQSLNLALHVGDDSKDVLENRRRAVAALGANLGDMVFCNQAHGREIYIVTAADRGRGAASMNTAIPATDALVTAEPGVVLTVMVADCVPVVLYDPVAHVLACVHAGWRGTVARVSEATVDAMRDLGSRPEDIMAGIGPAVGPDRYQVGAQVAEAVRNCFNAGASEVIRPDGTGRWLFDLWNANRILLREAGLRDENVHVAAVPTGTAGGGLFFSDREVRPCGRFAAIARLRPRERH